MCHMSEPSPLPVVRCVGACHDGVDCSAALQQRVHNAKVTFAGGHDESKFATAEEEREGKEKRNETQLGQDRGPITCCCTR